MIPKKFRKLGRGPFTKTILVMNKTESSSVSNRQHWVSLKVSKNLILLQWGSELSPFQLELEQLKLGTICPLYATILARNYLKRLKIAVFCVFSFLARLSAKQAANGIQLNKIVNFNGQMFKI